MCNIYKSTKFNVDAECDILLLNMDTKSLSTATGSPIRWSPTDSSANRGSRPSSIKTLGHCSSLNLETCTKNSLQNSILNATCRISSMTTYLNQCTYKLRIIVERRRLNLYMEKWNQRIHGCTRIGLRIGFMRTIFRGRLVQTPHNC